MMLGVVASDGRQMPPVWFEKKKGKKGIDSAHYIEVKLLSDKSKLFLCNCLNTMLSGYVTYFSVGNSISSHQ